MISHGFLPILPLDLSRFVLFLLSVLKVAGIATFISQQGAGVSAGFREIFQILHPNF